MQAPKIARDTAPFYWTYLECPTDGTIHLMWQPTSRRQTEFATDGYIWPAPERFWRQETGNGLVRDPPPPFLPQLAKVHLFALRYGL